MPDKKNPLIGAFRAPVPGAPPDKPAEEKKPVEPPKAAPDPKATADAPGKPTEEKKPAEQPKAAPDPKATVAAPGKPAEEKKPAEPPKAAPDPKAPTDAPLVSFCFHYASSPFSSSARVGRAGMAPLREHVLAAARLAKDRISSSSGADRFSSGLPLRRVRRLSTAPRKVSPAPLVSATVVWTPGTRPVFPCQR